MKQAASYSAPVANSSHHFLGLTLRDCSYHLNLTRVNTSHSIFSVDTLELATWHMLCPLDKMLILMSFIVGDLGLKTHRKRQVRSGINFHLQLRSSYWCCAHSSIKDLKIQTLRFFFNISSIISLKCFYKENCIDSFIKIAVFKVSSYPQFDLLEWFLICTLTNPMDFYVTYL